MERSKWKKIVAGKVTYFLELGAKGVCVSLRLSPVGFVQLEWIPRSKPGAVTL